MMASTPQKYGMASTSSSPSSASSSTPMNVPMENEYTMSIGRRPKLYDLNKNFTNFEIEFSIEAEKPTSSFFVYIMPQDQLDKVSPDFKEVDMKPVDGKISGKVSNYNDSYQNYFIILRADTDEDIRVQIRTQTIVLPLSHAATGGSTNPANNMDTEGNNNQPIQSMETSWSQDGIVAESETKEGGGIMEKLSRFTKSPTFFYVKIVVILLIVLMVGYMIYRSFSSSSTSPKLKEDVGNDDVEEDEDGEELYPENPKQVRFKGNMNHYFNEVNEDEDIYNDDDYNDNENENPFENDPYDEGEDDDGEGEEEEEITQDFESPEVEDIGGDGDDVDIGDVFDDDAKNVSLFKQNFSKLFPTKK